MGAKPDWWTRLHDAAVKASHNRVKSAAFRVEDVFSVLHAYSRPPKAACGRCDKCGQCGEWTDKDSMFTCLHKGCSDPRCPKKICALCWRAEMPI